jgi:hypothetical protein
MIHFPSLYITEIFQKNIGRKIFRIFLTLLIPRFIYVMFVVRQKKSLASHNIHERTEEKI